MLNKVDGESALFLIDCNFGRVSPRIKTPSYLGKAFTTEFDFYLKPGSYGPLAMFKNGEDGDSLIHFSENGVSTQYFANEFIEGFQRRFQAELREQMAPRGDRGEGQTKLRWAGSRATTNP